MEEKELELDKHNNNFCHPWNDFFQYLENCLNQVVKETKELYICGDFDFDLLKVGSDHNTHHFLTFCAVMDFYHSYFNPQDWLMIKLQS